jgi:hypothetical protein
MAMCLAMGWPDLDLTISPVSRRSRRPMGALSVTLLSVVVIFLAITAYELVKIRRILTSSASPVPSTGKPEDASEESP